MKFTEHMRLKNEAPSCFNFQTAPTEYGCISTNPDHPSRIPDSMHDFRWAYLRQDGQRGIGKQGASAKVQPMTA
jgi:hypothetical protein